MTRPQGMNLADYVRELTEPHRHSEQYTVRVAGEWVGRDHRTRVPSLITQLWNNDTPSQGAEDGPRPGYASRPAARLDALDTAARIDLQANRWILDIGDQPHSLDTADLIRQLHSITVGADDITKREVTRSVRSWWMQARIVTGWDSPAWTPDATCPSCGERGTLKVRLAEHIGMCTYRGDDQQRREACEATWDETTIGVLADHIRVESAAARTRRPGVGPCWCPLPKPSHDDVGAQCPRCGSSRCTHALQRRLIEQLRSQVGA